MIRSIGLLAATLAVGWFVFSGTTSVAASPVLPEPFPVAIDIPSINSMSDLVPLDLNSSGELEVPPTDQPEQAGWYVDGVRPGAIGPAVIAAHVNGNVNGVSTLGLFANLKEMKPGDLVHILRSDDSEVTFAVVYVQQYAKNEFPTEKVYGDTLGAELRLITCGGEYDSTERSYLDNIVVYAVKVS